MVGQEYWRVIPFYIIGKQFVCFQDYIKKSFKVTFLIFKVIPIQPDIMKVTS